MPLKQQSELCRLVLLALAGLKEDSSWDEATAEWLRIHDILSYVDNIFKKHYAENTRETIRKEALHFFRDAALIYDNACPTNSPKYKYRLTDEALQLIRSYGSESWQKNLANFISVHETLTDRYRAERHFNEIPVKVNGKPFVLSPGKHNQLQKAILEEFAPRFAQNSACLYVGDSTDRTLFVDEKKLNALGIELSVHNKLPDIILYREEKHWLYFIEAVTSVGAMTPQRVEEIHRMSQATSAGKIYLTAFPDWATYKKFASLIAWETEIWLSSDPDHLIHLNGDKFMGPRG